ncbi:MAG TPA: NAD-binding protein [Anaerolineaceae bacterium]|nr:NAD-binding protein [Anaerolineaceae bacterium]
MSNPQLPAHQEVNAVQNAPDVQYEPQSPSFIIPPKNKAARLRWRRIKASWRDTLLLLREFRRPLLWFIFIMIGSGVLYYFLAISAGEPVRNLVEAFYVVLTASFLQSGGSFPGTWYLQLFYFILPIVGISILAQGLADFGILFFNRHARGKDWEMAVASTFSNHVVLVGLGHLGYRVVKQLQEIGEEIVVVELNPHKDLVKNVLQLGIPVIDDDATGEGVLRAAGVDRAKAIVLCTQNDALNLQAAVKARNINHNIKVIIRIFDDDFATALHNQFGFTALSATGMAAPIFASAAANMDITPPINIEGRANSLARLQIAQQSSLLNQTISDIEDIYHVSIVYLEHQGASEFHPNGQIKLVGGDTLAILGEPEKITALINGNHT